MSEDELPGRKRRRFTHRIQTHSDLDKEGDDEGDDEDYDNFDDFGRSLKLLTMKATTRIAGVSLDRKVVGQLVEGFLCGDSASEASGGEFDEMLCRVFYQTSCLFKIPTSMLCQSNVSSWSSATNYVSLQDSVKRLLGKPIVRNLPQKSSEKASI